MKEMDREGLFSCICQGNLFEKSVHLFKGSSSIFIKTFMNSDIASHLDKHTIMHESLDTERILSDFSKQYEGRGSKKYDDDVMFWIGYTYRYWSYTYEMPSKKIYSIIDGTEMSKLFYPYHTMDCAKAIERIIEAKNIIIESPLDIVKKHILKSAQGEGR